MKIIINAKIWTMTGKDYDSGCILVDKGKICGVSERMEIPAGAEIIDAKGRIVMPGMIDAHCHIGVYEDGLGDEGSDDNEMVNPVTPYIRAIDAINPMNIAYKEAIEGGVTTVCTGPGSANVFGGTFTIMKTHGSCVDDMVLVKDYALKVAFGENPKRVYGGRKESPTTRMATAAIFREQMYKAKEYMEELSLYKDDTLKRPDYNFELENIVKVLKHEMPLKVHAHRADDIFTAIRLIDEFGVEATLDHCTEGYLITEELKKAGKPIITGPVILSRCKVELGQSSTSNPASISKAGLKFCIATDSPCIPVKYLSVSAGYVVSRGLDEREALKAITIYPAQILGIDKRVGSIEAGKDADLVFVDGHLFDFKSKITDVMVDGEFVYTNELTA